MTGPIREARAFKTHMMKMWQAWMASPPNVDEAHDKYRASLAAFDRSLDAYAQARERAVWEAAAALAEQEPTDRASMTIPDLGIYRLHANRIARNIRARAAALGGA